MISIYYTAKRNIPLTESENTAIENIVDKYNFGYPFEEKAEDFCVYGQPENDSVFSGATGLPYTDDYNLMFEICNYWLDCLTEITEVLKNCQWDVSMDDITLIYDNGWRFPER